MNARALLTFVVVLLAAAWLYHEADRVGPVVKRFLMRPREPAAAPAATPAELEKIGRMIAVGSPEPGAQPTAVTRGRCLLCHTLGRDDPRGFGPNLFAVAERAATRVAPGGGRSRTGVEYLVESLVCPSCVVVPGFGEEGSHDRISPMPRLQKPPMALTALEIVGVVEWLLTKDGGRPAPVKEIEAVVLAFTPPEDQTPGFLSRRPPATVRMPRRPGEGVGEMVASLSDDLPPHEILLRAGCTICHAVPGVTHAPCGAFALDDCAAAKPAPERLIGPTLMLKTTAARRAASREYQADVHAGRARARTAEEYVVESIVHPDAHTVPSFPPRIMAAEGLDQQLTAGAMRKVVEFLLTIDSQGPAR